MTNGTIEETYEYRIKRIVLRVLDGKTFKNGEDLESFLTSHRKDVADCLMDDIQEWMGFDDLNNELNKENNT